MDKNTIIELEDLDRTCLITRAINVLLICYTNDEDMLQCILRKDGTWVATRIHNGKWTSIGNGQVCFTYYTSINQGNELAVRFLYEEISEIRDP